MPENIIYIHNQPVSLLSTIMESAMSVAGMKNNIRRNIENHTFQTLPAPFSKSFNRHFNISTIKFANRNCFVIKPKINPGRKMVFYVHGGAYITNIIAQQWEMVESLILLTNFTFVVPDYETAPFATYPDMFNFIDGVYKNLIPEYKPEDIAFLGDSAGAGFLLGYLMSLRNEQQALPSQIILLSPWLDVTMQNPEIQALEKCDKMLAADGLQMAGKLFAGRMDTSDFRLSPVYGDFNQLCKISLFTGTHDLLYADCRKLKNQLLQAGIPFNYYEYPGMFHDWMIFRRLKEAVHALNIVAGLLKND